MLVALLPRRWLLFFCRATKATLRSFFGFFFLYLSLQLFHLLLERTLRRLGTPTSKLANTRSELTLDPRRTRVTYSTYSHLQHRVNYSLPSTWLTKINDWVRLEVPWITRTTRKGDSQVAALMYWGGRARGTRGVCWGNHSLWSFGLYLVVPVVSDKIASRRELDINQQSQSLAHCRQLDEGRIKQKLFVSSLTKTPSWEKSRAFVLCG